MKFHQLQDRAWLLVFDPGDDLPAIMLDFAREQKISGASIMGIGGFEHAVLGYLDLEHKKYVPIEIAEQVEVLSLMGSFAVDAETGEPRMHAHTVIGKRDGSTRGGHVIEARVRPTVELFVTAFDTRLQRARDPLSGMLRLKV